MKPRDRGSITVFVVVFMVALLAMAGLVIDGGHLLAARREAVNVAESAARAGAQEIDEASVREGSISRLDPGRAERRALNFLSASGYTGIAIADTNTIRVEVSIERRPFILGIVGVGSSVVRGRGVARAVQGVLEEDER